MVVTQALRDAVRLTVRLAAASLHDGRVNTGSESIADIPYNRCGTRLSWLTPLHTALQLNTCHVCTRAF